MFLVFDIETTGLPQFNKPSPENPSRYHSYETHEAYDSSRIVSIAWVVLSNDLVVKNIQCFYVKPGNFTIPDCVVKIHGITTEFATANGVPFETVCNELYKTIVNFNIDTLVAHNLGFDYNILLSEVHRLHQQSSPLLQLLNKMKQRCTMQMGRVLFNGKYPKLHDLFTRLFEYMDPSGAHDALDDTEHCAACFVKLTLDGTSKSTPTCA